MRLQPLPLLHQFLRPATGATEIDEAVLGSGKEKVNIFGMPCEWWIMYIWYNYFYIYIYVCVCSRNKWNMGNVDDLQGASCFGMWQTTCLQMYAYIFKTYRTKDWISRYLLYFDIFEILVLLQCLKIACSYLSVRKRSDIWGDSTSWQKAKPPSRASACRCPESPSPDQAEHSLVMFCDWLFLRKTQICNTLHMLTMAVSACFTYPNQEWIVRHELSEFLIWGRPSLHDYLNFKGSLLFLDFVISWIKNQHCFVA